MSLLPREALEREIIRQTEARGDESSICPSDVARALTQDWRPLLNPVREAAIALLRAGRIEVLRKGKAVGPEDVRGVIRLRRPR